MIKNENFKIKISNLQKILKQFMKKKAYDFEIYNFINKNEKKMFLKKESMDELIS